MAETLKDLRGCAFRGSTQRESFGVISLDSGFGHFKICKFQVAIFANENVLWFQTESDKKLLSEDDVLRMQIVEG